MATIVAVSMADASNNNNLQTATKQQQKMKPSWHVRHASRTWQLLDKQQIKLPGRAGDTVFKDKRTSASNTTKNAILLVSKNKKDTCCSMLWPGHSNFKLNQKSKNNFVWLPTTRMPRVVARLANLPLKDKILIWQNMLYRVLDMSTQYNIDRNCDVLPLSLDDLLN